MPLTFWKSPRFNLRALLGANLVSDIDAGFQALAEDLDAILCAPGDLRLTAKQALDAGWLACEGQAVSRVTYKALFEAIGTAYGEGDKATTFNVPDYRGRVPVGAGAGTGLTARARGAKLGEETHLLSAAELPVTKPTFGLEFSFYMASPTGTGPIFARPSASGEIGAIPLWDSDLEPHSFGGSQGHNNMQPSTVCNVWIRT
jgi:microcystin-dependent protein